jgi:hypothetical protein
LIAKIRRIRRIRREINLSFRTKNFSKRRNAAYLPKVKPSAGPHFLSEKNLRDREGFLKNALNL